MQLKRRLVPMGSIMWERDVAEVYDQTYRAKFEPSVLDPIVDLLAGLAGGGTRWSSPSGFIAFQLARRRQIVRLMVLVGSESGFRERAAWTWPLGDRECG